MILNWKSWKERKFDRVSKGRKKRQEMNAVLLTWWKWQNVFISKFHIFLSGLQSSEHWYAGIFVSKSLRQPNWSFRIHTNETGIDHSWIFERTSVFVAAISSMENSLSVTYNLHVIHSWMTPDSLFINRWHFTVPHYVLTDLCPSVIQITGVSAKSDYFSITTSCL